MQDDYKHYHDHMDSPFFPSCKKKGRVLRMRNKSRKFSQEKVVTS